MEETTKVRLNLASGAMYLDGWENIDNKSQYNGNFSVDKDADIFILEYPENSVDEILLSHFAMYMTPKEMKVQALKWHTWLKIGGKLTIETSDIKKMAVQIISCENPDALNEIIKGLYGEDTTIGHKWTWCRETLINILSEVGFKNFSTENGGLHGKPERDITIIAIK